MDLPNDAVICVFQACAGVCDVAEADGNRTRQTRFTRLNRFEDGEAHQALGRLRVTGY